MEKTTVYLPSEIVCQLKELSRRSGTSQAEIIRQALRAYLDRQTRPAPRSMGIVRSGKIRARDDEAWLRENWHPR